jgi:hypothetical protein
MASNKNTDAINQLLGTSSTRSVKKVSKADKPVTAAQLRKVKEKSAHLAWLSQSLMPCV